LKNEYRILPASIFSSGHKTYFMSYPENTISVNNLQWFRACNTSDAAANGGVCVKYGEEQIALFYFTRRNVWFASQNVCPHKQQMALSRGIIGSEGDEPKIACPFHKRSFSLVDGHCMNDNTCQDIKTYPVRVENDQVYIGFEIIENVSG
jgi:nitrite reductase (NADH) small subunit